MAYDLVFFAMHSARMTFLPRLEIVPVPYEALRHLPGRSGSFGERQETAAIFQGEVDLDVSSVPWRIPKPPKRQVAISPQPASRQPNRKRPIDRGVISLEGRIVNEEPHAAAMVLFRLIGVGAEFRVHARGLDIVIRGGRAEQLFDEAAPHAQEIAGLLTLQSSGKSSFQRLVRDPFDSRVNGKKLEKHFR
jgi:hypothetical protein